MNFNFLAENSLSFYPVSPENAPENIQDTFMRNEEQLQQLQINLESFNEYSKSFGALLESESVRSSVQFQALLMMYMHCTNTRLRKRENFGATTWKCYCLKKTTKNSAFYSGRCNFSIAVQKTDKQDELRILETNFEHNHVMLPKSLYFQLVCKASMVNLKTPIKQHIQTYLESNKSKKKDDHHNVMFVTGKRDLETIVSLYAKEVSPKCILESLLKSKETFNLETKRLLEALEEKKDSSLHKKFDNLVNSIKKKMVIAAS